MIPACFCCCSFDFGVWSPVWHSAWEKSEKLRLGLNREWHSAVLFYFAAAWFSGAFTPLDLCCSGARKFLPLWLATTEPTNCGFEWMASLDILVKPCSWLQYETEFVLVFDLSIFTYFNIWCMCFPVLLFSIEQRGWAWIIHPFFIFSQYEHDSQGWGKGWSANKPRKDSPISVLTVLFFYTATLSK